VNSVWFEKLRGTVRAGDYNFYMKEIKKTIYREQDFFYNTEYY